MNIQMVSGTKRRHKAERAYVVHWIRNPDKGSAFDRKTRLIRWLPGWFLIWLMGRLKYEGMLFYEGVDFVGHIFFQKHAKDWRAFSVFVTEHARGRGYAQKMVAEFLTLAHEEEHLKSVMIGAGGIGEIGDAIVLHISKKAANNQLGLPFSLMAGVRPGSVLFT